MTEYRQWHDINNDEFTFFHEGKIYFCQCGLNHKLSLQELPRLVTDAAVEDFNQRLMGYDELTANGIGILVSRQSFRIHSMPEGNRKVTVRTWEEKPEALQFVRSYEIYDTETKEKLVSGLSTWLLVDLNKRRILPIKNFTMRKAPELQTEHDCLPLGKIAFPENAELLCERPIWYSDIDGNGHMNNARYGAFVVDCMPEKYREKTFTDFKINYSKEAVLGENIKLFGTFDDEAGKAVIIGKQEENICFESEVYYK